MKISGITIAGLIGLLLASIDAHAVPIYRTVLLDSPTGSFTFSFDPDTAPVGTECGALCALTDVALSTGGHAWSMTELTSQTFVFDPVAVLSTWTLSFSYVSGTKVAGSSTEELIASFTGSADETFVTESKLHSKLWREQCSRPTRNNPGQCHLVPEPSVGPLVKEDGTWSLEPIFTPALFAVDGPDADAILSRNVQVPEPGAGCLAMVGAAGALSARRRRILAGG